MAQDKNTKLNIIKKFLDIESWEIKEEKDQFTHYLYIFNRDGNCIIRYDVNIKMMYYHYRLIKENIRKLFGFDIEEIKELMKTLVEEHFKLKIGVAVANCKLNPLYCKGPLIR